MLSFGRIWALGLWIRNAVGHFKWGLMGHPSRSIENHGDGDLICGGLTQKISEKNNFSILPKGGFCYILVKKVPDFFNPCQKYLPGIN